MDIGSGLLMLLIGSLVTIGFFIIWFKAMEAEAKNDDENTTTNNY